MEIEDLEEKWKILTQRVVDFKNGEITSREDDSLSFYLKKCWWLSFISLLKSIILILNLRLEKNAIRN